jgi:tetratricopeptide (TPR) repeat protein
MKVSLSLPVARRFRATAVSAVSGGAGTADTTVARRPRPLPISRRERGPQVTVAGWLLTCLLVLLLAGCATWSPLAGGVHEERKKRDAEIALRLSNKRDIAEFQAAADRWQQQDMRGCREQLESLLSRNPQHREARLLMADVLVAANQPKEAKEHVQKVLDANPDDADAQYAMGLLLDTGGEHAAALARYERAATLAPDNEVYAVNYRIAREPGQAEGQRRLAAATASSAQSVAPDQAAPPAELRPSPADAKSIVAPAPADSRRAPAKGGALAVSASSTSPSAGYAGCSDRAEQGPAAPQLQKGCAALADGSPDKARDYFRQAAAVDPDNPQVLIFAGTAALGANQPRLAVDLLAPAANRFAGSAALHRILGAAYYRLGDYQSSQLALRQALSLDKSHALSYFLMGCTMAKLGQVDQANAYLQQAQAIDPKYAVAR